MTIRFIALIAFFFLTSTHVLAVIAPIKINSPDNALTIEFFIEQGKANYRLLHQNQALLTPSSLGFIFAEQPALLGDFVILASNKSSVNNVWQRQWGESKLVHNHYRELTVSLQERTNLKRQLSIVFRLYNDGVGVRYLLPAQPHLQSFAITSEETEFSLNGQHTLWSTPANYDSYEAEYRRSKLSDVNAVNTPITLKSEQGLYLSIHEAALTNYAGMTLIKKAQNPYQFTSDLVPWPDGIKVKGQTPFKTPWRTIQVAESAAELITSDLIVNLNEPNVIEDTSWIKPMKYLGIWWGMHMREYTWQAGPKHGATTENAKNYIDFAKKHGIEGLLVEGWNQGWETWHSGLNIQDFTKAYDDFDLVEVAAYGAKNNVALIGHHETGGNIPSYEKQMDVAFKLYSDVGVHAIKTGYAGKMIPAGVYHHGQEMVNHYRKVVELAAKHQIMVNAHEPIKPTGIRRTYPNMMTREGGKGMEWNGWSAGNSPEHTVTLPFTRLLAGPMDYTPGIFNIEFDRQKQYRVHSTLARQLAMYVVLYSPLQMAADMIENYQAKPAFEFIEKVPTTWDETKVLTGEIGDYISIARRSGQQWFIGSMTDEQPRLLNIKLDFLAENIAYIARVFSDANKTSYHDNPTDIDIESYLVKKDDELAIAMTGSGGQALYLTPLTISNGDLPLITEQNQRALAKMKIYQRLRQYGAVKRIKHLAVNKKIQYFTDYDKAYRAGGESALVDGIVGGADYKTFWQGYRKNNLNVVIDLGEQQLLSSVEIGFLQSVLHSILLPSKVNFSLANDNEAYRSIGELHFNSVESMPDFQQKQFKVRFDKQSARFIKITAKNVSELPDWHIRAGQESFIFADEVIVH